MIVTTVLMDGTVLTLRAKKFLQATLVLLEGNYALAGGYGLYKRKDNVICGEQLEYKVLDIHIEK